MDNIKTGGIYVFLAAAAYACMSALVKAGGSHVSDELLVFMRNAVCLALLLPSLFIPKIRPLSTPLFSMHAIRAVAGLLNMYCFFYSIHYILLSDAMLLNNTMPLFVPIIMWIWKGKKISFSLLPGLFLGFFGIVLILNPGRDLFHPVALIALASGLFMSISMTGIRELSRTEPLYRILFYYFAISTLISAFPLIWGWKTHSLIAWIILVSVGIFAALYQFLLTRGYSLASASKVSPLIYFAVVLSGIFDWAFWNKKPDLLSFVGLFLVVLGAILCIQSEAKT